MTTTAVFAEILVVGLEAEAWLTLFVLAVFGTEWVDLGAVDAWATLVTVLVLATAYVLGILIDRIADKVVVSVAKKVTPVVGSMAKKLTRFSRARKGSGDGDREDDEASVAPDGIKFERMRMEVLHKSEGMVKFLDYQRSRQRVARGTVLNTALAIPAVLAFLASQTDASVTWLLVALAAGLVIFAAALFANERIYRAYTRNLIEAYKIVRD